MLVGSSSLSSWFPYVQNWGAACVGIEIAIGFCRGDFSIRICTIGWAFCFEEFAFHCQVAAKDGAG